MSTNNNFDSATSAPLEKSSITENTNTAASNVMLNEVMQSSYQTPTADSKAASNANSFLPQLTLDSSTAPNITPTSNPSSTNTLESTGNFNTTAENVITDITKLANEWQAIDAGALGPNSGGLATSGAGMENTGAPTSPTIAAGNQYFADLNSVSTQMLDMGFAAQSGNASAENQAFQQVQLYLAKMQNDLGGTSSLPAGGVVSDTGTGQPAGDGSQSGGASPGGDTAGNTGNAPAPGTASDTNTAPAPVTGNETNSTVPSSDLTTGSASDSGSTSPTTPSDPIIQALQQTDPQAAQVLTDSQSTMSQAGFSQFETQLQQNIQGGQYADVLSAANSAAGQLQASGNTADYNTATSVINNDINPTNDAAVSTYSPANDAQVTNLANTGDGQLQQDLQTAWGDVQNGQLSPYGYSQFENTTIPLTNTNGQYPTDQALEQAALTQLQTSLSTSDQNTLQGIVGGQPTPTGGITANVNGFFDSNGNPINLVGLNATPEDAVTGFGHVKSDFPGLNAIRLNVDPSNTGDPNIATAINEYTNAGIAVELEVHDTDGNGSGFDSVYQQWAQQYKNNPLVLLETPNEPNESNLAADDAQYIQEIRAQGFNNPIGIQPIGGYDQSNIPAVLQDLQNMGVSTSNLYVTPHIYDNNPNPNDAMNYAQSEVSSAQQQGLPALIDEYGPAENGYTIDPQGEMVNAAMYTLAQSGYGTQQHVGSIYWGMDNANHPDGADSAFLTPDGSQLTPDGQLLQQTILA
jgi:hypothetical protein